MRPILLATITTLLVACALVGLVLFRDVRAVRTALDGLESSLEGARSHLEAADVEASRAALRDAQGHARRARIHSDGPLWALGERLPWAWPTFRSVREVVAIGRLASDIAESVTDATASLIRNGELQVRSADGRIDIEALRALGTALADLPTDELRARRERLLAIEGAVPGEVAAGRDRVLTSSARTLDVLDRATDTVSILPSFLGGDGPRRYFVGMQNPAELRGTGGLIGLYAVLTVVDGDFSLSEPQVYEALDDDVNESEEPVDAPAAFEERYAHVNAAGNLANVNVDPDLPTVAPVLLDLYEVRTGERLDGVILMDPIALSHVLGAIGPLDLPDEVVEGTSLPDPLPADELPETVLVEVYGQLGGDTDERRDFLKAVASRALEVILSTSWDVSAVVERIATAAAQRHIQIHSTREDEQVVFASLGVDGAMTGPGDLFAVTANNAAANKLDVHVAHEFDIDVALDVTADGAVSRTASVEVRVDNPVEPGEFVDYIAGSSTGNRNRGGPEGLNRTWFTVWAHGTSEAVAGRSRDGTPLRVVTGRIHDHLAVDHYLETHADSTSHFALDIAGPVELERDGSELVYRLTLWRQAKAIPDALDLSIASEAWRILDVGVSGAVEGEDAAGRDSTVGDLDVTVEGDHTVTIVGETWRDVKITVRLGR